MNGDLLLGMLLEMSHDLGSLHKETREERGDGTHFSESHFN